MGQPSPRSSSELNSRLESEVFDGVALARDVVGAFVATIKYSDGKVAHMDYGAVQDSLSEKGFTQFLSMSSLSVSSAMTIQQNPLRFV